MRKRIFVFQSRRLKCSRPSYYDDVTQSGAGCSWACQPYIHGRQSFFKIQVPAADTRKKKQTKNLSNDFDYFNLTQSNAWMVDHARITPVQGAYSGQRVYRILKLLLSLSEWFFCAVYISCTPRYMFVLFFINKSLPVFYNTLTFILFYFFSFFHFLPH